MVLLEDPEPPSNFFKYRKEMIGIHTLMFVVRKKDNDKFVTAFRTRNECEVWINNESKRVRRSHT